MDNNVPYSIMNRTRALKAVWYRDESLQLITWSAFKVTNSAENVASCPGSPSHFTCASIIMHGKIMERESLAQGQVKSMKHLSHLEKVINANGVAAEFRVICDHQTPACVKWGAI